MEPDPASAQGGYVTDPAYRALALQFACRSVNDLTDPTEARARMSASIGRLRAQVASSVAFIGSDCRLVVLPEYFLSGHPVGEPFDVWAAKAALSPDGPEYEALGGIAQDAKIYLSGNAYELDASFPGLYFQTSFVIAPSGDVALRYRRLNSLMTPTPHDVWDRYLDRYGLDGVFPVARTEIGNLACIASEEILFPELARTFAVRGAEVFLHSTSEATSPLLTVKEIARRARAVENLAYVVSANSAGIEGSPIPGASTNGGSQVVDFEGRILAEAGPGESMVANAEVDLAAVRRARRRPGMGNLLARNRFELYADTYATTKVHPANTLEGMAQPSRAELMESHRSVIQRLAEEGLI